MNERAMQLRIGLMVLAALIITATLLVMFGETPELFQKKAEITIVFPEAPSVNEKTPVRRRGVLIGTVTGVEFIPAGGVQVTAEIDADKMPHSNEQCWITPSLMGDSNVNFIAPVGEPLSGRPAAPGATFTGFVAPDPVHAVAELQRNLSRSLESVVKTSEGADEMMSALRDMFEDNEERIKTIAQTAEENMKLINTTLKSVNEIMTDEAKEDIKTTIREIPGLVRKTEDMFGQVQQTMRTVDARLAEITDFTATLGRQGPNMIAQLEEGVRNFNSITREINAFSHSLNSGEGSLGLMLRDRELYRNVNQAAANIEELTRQLRPVVNDFRVFSDKIARHPEVLGVRGAMQQNVGTKGVPTFSPFR